MRRTLAASRDWFNAALTAVGLAIYCAMILVVGLQMSVRWVLGPVFDVFWVWTGNLAEYLLVFLTFVGAGIVARDREHISLDFVTDRAPASVVAVLVGVQTCLMILFAAVLLRGAVPMYDQTKTTALGALPRTAPFTSGWYYVGASVGATLIILFAVRDLGRLLRRPETFANNTDDPETDE
jgi:TRAP-type C4-dicarboxylate transport system permease small subunit